MRDPRRRAWTASLASSLLILSLGVAPITNAADHLDSEVTAEKGSTDITDLYTFSARHGTQTVFIVGINPGAGVLANSGTTFGPRVDYYIKIDTNGNAKPDITYKYAFGKANGNGVQKLDLWRNDDHVASGWTGMDNDVDGGGMTTAGLYDDPFFFDLAAFQGAVLGSGNGRTFCDDDTVDFFLGLNLNAIVLQVPNSELGGNGKGIGVWTTTTGIRNGKRVQIDQMGRPAINTVFNNQDEHKADRQMFNQTKPAKQWDKFGGHVEDVLEALGAADPAGLASVLIPDVMTYETGNKSGFLNGRRLADDVIDAELGLVTNGGISTDCVDNDSAFPGSWPYLAPAN